MKRLRIVMIRLTGLFHRAKHERDWNLEFESHLHLHIEDNIRAGMSPDEARRQALLKFGGVEPVKESMRERATFTSIDTTLRDLRYAVRNLTRNPGFAMTTISSLTLGLGASLAIFTVADNVLVRPLPYHDASRLVMLWEANAKYGENHNVVSPADYLDWKSQNDVVEDLAGLSPVRSVVLADNGRAEEFGARSVTADFFPLLGIQPIRGRLFTPEEDRPPTANHTTVSLISYRLWQNWFGGDENVVGRKIQINSFPSTIIGVLPSNFHFLDRDTDLWAPLGLSPAQDYRKTQGRWMVCVGRLRPGIELGQAQTHMSALAKRLETAYPAFNTNWGIHVESLRDAMYGQVKTPLLVLLAAVVMLLTVACANVANLLLARYSSRRREIAVRVSLGAGRWRVIRQLLTESVVLGALGGVLGIALARWFVVGLLALVPKDLAQSTEIHVDFRVILFAVALSLLTGILFGLAPALVTSRVELISAFRGDNRSGVGAGHLLRSWLVGCEVAISVILLTGSTLLFRSLVGLEAVNPGMDSSNLLTFRVTLSPIRYRETRARTQFFGNAVAQIERLPGVQSASAASCLPFTGTCAGTGVKIEGRPPAKPGEGITASVQTVMPGYFRTLRIPIE